MVLLHNTPLLIGPHRLWQEKPESGAAALGLENVGGIFLVLVVGLSLSCLVASLEYAWSRRRLTRPHVSNPLYHLHVCYSRLEQAQAHPPSCE